MSYVDFSVASNKASSSSSSSISPSSLISCHECNKSGVPLHTNDDPNSESTISGQKPRYCSSCMVGKKVRVFWPVDKSWYTGTVREYDVNTGEHLLRYDDDDIEWVKIGEHGGSHGGGTTRTSSPPHSSANVDIQQPNSPSLRILIDSKEAETSPIPQHQSQTPQVFEPTKDSGYMARGPHPPSYRPYGHMPAPLSTPQVPYHHAPPPPMGYPSYPSPYGVQPPHPYHPNVTPTQSSPYGYPQMVQNNSGPMVNQNRRDLDHNSTSNSADKGKKKAGPKVWTKDEDMMLLNMVQSMRMPIKWSVVAQQMQDRTGKQCRERYVNHLNPRLKVTDWNPVEDATIFHLYNTAGSHWAKMSKMIPGRTDNGIKNRFHNLRRQLEREDEHRLRLSKAEDFPEEIRIECIREFPKHLWGKNDELWDIHRGLPVLAAQSVLGGGISRNAGRFGPFRTPDIAAGESDLCVRCGFLIPSVHTGAEVCTKTGWCVSCTRVPPHISGALLRECLNLRRCDDKEFRPLVESWTDLFHITDIITKKEEGEGQ